MSKEREMYGIKVIVDNETYNEYKGTLEEQIDELQERIDKATQELFELKNMIYKPETREENIPIQRKISNIIIGLNGKGSEDNDK